MYCGPPNAYFTVRFFFFFCLKLVFLHILHKDNIKRNGCTHILVLFTCTYMYMWLYAVCVCANECEFWSVVTPCCCSCFCSVFVLIVSSISVDEYTRTYVLCTETPVQ